MISPLEKQLEKLLSRVVPSEVKAGIDWYPSAHTVAARLGQTYSVETPRVCAVIAALSPGCPWDRNIEDAETLISAWRKGEPLPLVGVYGRRNRDKAIAVLEAETFSPDSVFNPITGPKVWNFYACINEPATPEHIVIDRHAKCAALGITTERDSASIVTRAEYKSLSASYRNVARSIGFTPAETQAIIWVHWRNQFSTRTSSNAGNTATSARTGARAHFSQPKSAPQTTPAPSSAHTVTVSANSKWLGHTLTRMGNLRNSRRSSKVLQDPRTSTIVEATNRLNNLAPPAQPPTRLNSRC